MLIRLVARTSHRSRRQSLKPQRRRIHTSPRLAATRTHAHLIKAGAAADVNTWNAVLTAYGKHGRLSDARKLFDEIPVRDTVSWNALISVHVSRGEHEASRDLFRTMARRGLAFDAYTLGSIIKSAACVARLEHGRQLHCLVAKAGFDGDVYAGSAVVDMYGKCGMTEDAYKLFRNLPLRNAVSWNAVIAGFVLAGNRDRAIQLFSGMDNAGFLPDEATFASVLTLLDGPEFYRGVLQLHAKIIKCGWALDTIAHNAAITAYCQCGSVCDAEKVFVEMDQIRDLVTWNSLLAGYACYGLASQAVRLFVEMMEVGIGKDMYSFTSVISACFEKAHCAQGKALHSMVVKSGWEGAIPVSNSLIAMYTKSGDGRSMQDAVKCFDLMELRDNVSWNSVLTGLSQSGLSEDAMKFFCRMQSFHLKIDHFSFSAALRSCSDLAVLELGRQIHGSIIKSGFGANDFVISSLIYMYSKSGVINEARKAFDESGKDNSVTWNSIIFGYAQHGHAQTAIDLFSEMQEKQVEPDHITFVGILSACSHIGLVDEGTKILESMETVYGVQLRMEHYACGVDLFGRAGKLDAAKRLINSMPFEPDAMVWLTLLGACRIHGDIELASQIARRLLMSEPQEHSTYVILSHMFSTLKLWESRAVVQKAMRDRELGKVPGWSWIEVHNTVHAFNAEDRSHPQADEIYATIIEIMEEIGKLHHDTSFEFTMHDLCNA